MNTVTGCVYVVDDDEAVCQALTFLFRSIRLDVVACPSAEAFLSRYDPATPGCLVLDVRMPGTNGLELLDQLVEHDLAVPVIILSGHGDVPMAVRAVKRGALDFIQKPGDEQRMIDLVQEALRRNAECLIARSRRSAELERFRHLSERERQVVESMAEGLPNRAIAQRLSISERTVETHRLNALKKLDMRFGADLVRLVDHAGGACTQRCPQGLAAWCPSCRLLA